MDLTKAFKVLEAKAEESIPVEAEDYIGADGLWICGKCGTPKQKRITIMDQEMTPMCLCKCGKERFEAEQQSIRDEKRQRKIEFLREKGFHDEAMRRWRFENDDQSNAKLSTLGRRYVERFPEFLADGKGLLLFGEVGTGKSFISACIANALIDQGYPCICTNLSLISGLVKADGREDALDELDRYALVVLDDLMAERDTEYMNELVHEVIDRRYRSGKPLIVTTNMTAEEIKSTVNIRRQRIFSRLMEICIPYEVKGVDRRREVLKQDFGKYAEILGLKE